MEMTGGGGGGEKAVTVLCELGGADQRGDLEVVLADGTVAQVLGAFPSCGIALFLQLQLGGGQVQVQRRVLQFLRLRLFFSGKVSRFIGKLIISI